MGALTSLDLKTMTFKRHNLIVNHVAVYNDNILVSTKNDLWTFDSAKVMISLSFLSLLDGKKEYSVVISGQAGDSLGSR